MALTSVSKQVINKFIEELEVTGFLNEGHLESLKKILHSRDLRKDDIAKLLKIEENDENS